MDINSLLSPSENPQAHSPTPGDGGGSTPSEGPSQSYAQSPFKHVQRSNSGKSGMVNSPLSRSVQPASSIPAHVRSPSQQTPHSSPLISPVPAGTVTAHLPRTSSASSLEASADFS